MKTRKTIGLLALLPLLFLSLMIANQVEGVSKTSGEEKGSDRILKTVSLERVSLQRLGRDLQLEEDRLKKTRKEIEDRLKELRQFKTDLVKELELLKTERDKEMVHLVKVYESMDPEQAAPLLETMEMKIAVDLLSRMKGRKAGKILEFVRDKKAVRLSEELANRMSANKAKR
jgi:flagellar motility protein MotE (MotC chaperone)